MPYVEQADRTRFQEALDKIPMIMSPGQLNYLFTSIAIKYLEYKNLSYQSLNDISGALTNANLEIYRRVTVLYEEEKARDNGDLLYPGEF